MGWERGDFGLRKTSIKRDLSAFKYMKCYRVYNADSLLSTPPSRKQPTPTRLRKETFQWAEGIF